MKLLILPLLFCLIGEASNPSFENLSQYENSRTLNLSPKKSFEEFEPQVGIWATAKDKAGNTVAGKIRVLSDNPQNSIWFLSDFNDWGKKLTPEDELHPVSGTPYFEGKIRRLKAGMPYRLKVNGVELIDPAATTFSSTGKLNSIYWDFSKPQTTLFQAPATDLRGTFVAIGEEEVYELVKKWPVKSGGESLSAKNTYRFVTESGIIPALKEMGYNAIEFLPFNSSVDGETWSKRYQVYGLYGPDSRYGTPDEFRKMVSAFNQAGIGIIMDAVIGHYPYQGNADNRDLSSLGLQKWLKADGRALFGQTPSPWKTNRYDYANPAIRRFLIDAILKNLKDYHLSGIRIDNLDGIRLYDGPGGGGPEFIKELVEEIRAYQPGALIIGEMFFPCPSVLSRLDAGGFGINIRSHSDLFDFFKDNLIGFTENLDLKKAATAISAPWNWGELPRFNYLTNHDEASNPRGGATGSYVASLLKSGGWSIVENKTIAFASLAMLSSSYYLDMPQLRILQEGSFYSNPAVDWSLLELPSQKRTRDYFSKLTWALRKEKAFAFQNLSPNLVNHTDDNNKVISILRTDFDSGKKIYALINLGHHGINNYSFGVESKKPFHKLLDSQEQNPGQGEDLFPTDFQLHGKPGSLTVPYLAPYGVILLEEKDASTF